MRQAAILIAVQIAMYALGAFVAWDPLWLSALGDVHIGDRFLIAFFWAVLTFCSWAFQQ